MRQLGTLLRAAHPLPTAAVTTLTAGMCVVFGTGPARALFIVAAVACGQLSIGWSNDAIDARRDARADRADKPVARGEVTSSTLWVAALIALAVCVPLSFACGTQAGAVHLVAVAGGWAYNLGLKSTAWSWSPYALSFGLLPVFVWAATPALASANSWPPWWLVTACAALGVGAHVANALPDVDDDRADGVAGLATRMSPKSARSLMTALFAIALALVVFAPPGAPSKLALSALLLGTLASLAVATPSRIADQTAFRLAIALAGLALLVMAGTDFVASSAN